MANLTDLIDPIPPVHVRALEDAPFSVTYVFPAKDFAAGANWTEVIESPPGFRGKVRAITLYDVTEIFNEPTTPAYVYVGLSGDIDAFCTSASLGALATTASDSPALTDGATHIIQPNATIHVTGVGNTGAGLTGIAATAVTIQYFK